MISIRFYPVAKAMAAIGIFLLLLPRTNADGWDDFVNSIGTDLVMIKARPNSQQVSYTDKAFYKLS